jgi:hypothetical protein
MEKSVQKASVEGKKKMKKTLVPRGRWELERVVAGDMK